MKFVMRKSVSLMLFVSIFLLGSCSSTPASGDQSDGASAAAEGDTAVIDSVAKPLLLEQLDSLKRDLIYFPPVDSINSIEPRVAKKNRRDSLYKELNKKPKHVYLTFDDGPLIGSAAIDSIVTAKDIKINVFLIGKHAKMSKHLAKSLARYLNNPLVASYNHSFTHANNRYQTFYKDPTLAYNDFLKAQVELGLTQKVARLPGRNIWMFDDISRVDGVSGGSTAKMLHDDGYNVYGWDVEWRINGRTGVPVQTVEQTFSKMKSYLDNHYGLFPNNVVLLMHDDMFQNKVGQNMLVQLIDKLKGEGYTFEFLTDYPVKY